MGGRENLNNFNDNKYNNDNKHILRIYCVPGTILSALHALINSQNSLVRRDDNNPPVRGKGLLGLFLGPVVHRRNSSLGLPCHLSTSGL